LTTGEPYKELVVGLVGPVGSSITRITETLEDAFDRVDYSHHIIHLSQHFSEFPNIAVPELGASLFERTCQLMDAGDELRERFGPDAVAVLAVAAIREIRGKVNVPRLQSLRTAYIIRSLKRPEEVQLLRRVYGANFILIGAHLARERRLTHLAQQIATSIHRFADQDFTDQAAQLIQRDETDPLTPHGQNVRDAFPEADVFFDMARDGQLPSQVQRFIDLVLGHPYHTPSRDEYGMFLAHAARLRSAALSRQVGAAIATSDGEILSVGTNEVPKAGGGQYWPETPDERRDYVLKIDSSDEMKQGVLVDLLKHLKDAGWLSEEFSKKDPTDWIAAIMEEHPQVWQESHVANLIEFGRIVHAEMAAITNAARLGLPLGGSTLYTTTFPCHDCAKHIIAAGITRVVFVDPYPKSLVGKLFEDSIFVDPDIQTENKVSFQHFTGVAPRAYQVLFEALIRKDALGKTIKLDMASSNPKAQEVFENVWWNEEDVMKRFNQFNQGQLKFQ